MDALAIAQRYFDAWNAHDSEALVASFAPGGVYRDPNVPQGLDAAGTAQYAAGLAAAFPDLSFELVSTGLTGDGLVAAQWVMRGTNTGSFQGLPPTGREIALPGADFIRADGDGVHTVDGYFDGRTMVEQLGLDAIVQPRELGPFRFGTSTHVTTGKRTQPGAISITALEVHDEAERQRVREMGRETLKELLGTPGFVSAVTAVVGTRMLTFTAWEDVDSVRQMRGNEAHRAAMQVFFGPEFAAGGQTGVWAPERLNGMWVRCTACGEMVKADGSCGSCGEALPQAPAWL